MTKHMNLAEAGTFGRLSTALSAKRNDVTGVHLYRRVQDTRHRKISSTDTAQTETIYTSLRLRSTRKQNLPAVNPAHQLCVGCEKLPAA